MLLQAFIAEAGSAKSDELLSEIISEHAYTMIRRVLFARFNIGQERWNSAEGRDLEDLTNEIVLQLIDRLLALRRGKGNLVENFSSYVAVTTHNAFNAYLRQKYPERSRLKDKLRYLLTHHEQFALWQSQSQGWMCGFSLWQGRQPSDRAFLRLREVQSDQSWLCGGQYSVGNGTPGDVLRFVKAVFEFIGEPIPFNSLVDIASDAFGVKIRMVPLDSSHSQYGSTSNTTADMDGSEREEQRRYLRQVWEEISRLPLPQRTALLLNLRNDTGANITDLLSCTRVITMREMAEALAMPIEELCQLWNRLPLSDAEIALRLGMMTQQMATLRQSARRRLRRRTAALGERRSKLSKEPGVDRIDRLT